MAKEKKRNRKEEAPIAPRLLSTKQAAGYLGYSRQTIYNGRVKNSQYKFPVEPKKVGGKLLWDRKELDAFIDSL